MHSVMVSFRPDTGMSFSSSKSLDLHLGLGLGLRLGLSLGLGLGLVNDGCILYIDWTLECPSLPPPVLIISCLT